MTPAGRALLYVRIGGGESGYYLVGPNASSTLLVPETLGVSPFALNEQGTIAFYSHASPVGSFRSSLQMTGPEPSEMRCPMPARPAPPTPTVAAEPSTVATTSPVSAATPTLEPMSCVGDCNRDGVVALGELIVSTRLATGAAEAELCTACDMNSDGRIAVNEILRAVGQALRGCNARDE